jgi:hypothetical protein
MLVPEIADDRKLRVRLTANYLGHSPTFLG